ncbi:MAG: hypothetical protein SPK06_07690 [Kiritimatiellia bacterium]|nr:hypothetical protein [Kiritimatiellia bacterium]
MRWGGACTADALGVVTCTADAAIALAPGARLALQKLALSDTAALTLSGSGALTVAQRLSLEDLARLTFDGAPAAQTPSGRITPRRTTLLYLF